MRGLRNIIRYPIYLHFFFYRVMFLKFPLATLQIGKEKLVTSIILSTTGLSLSIIVCYIVENFFWQKPTMMSIYRDGQKTVPTLRDPYFLTN